MKKTIYILLTILLSLTLIGAKAQETPPSGLKSVNGQFYISLADSSIWQNKGVPYGWQRVARYKDIKNLPTQAIINAKIDSLKAANNTWNGNNTFTGTTTFFKGKNGLLISDGYMLGSASGGGVFPGGTDQTSNRIKLDSVKFELISSYIYDYPSETYIKVSSISGDTSGITIKTTSQKGLEYDDQSGAYPLTPTNRSYVTKMWVEAYAPSGSTIASTYAKKDNVIKNQNTITQSANAKISGNITSGSQTISNGTDSVRTTIESIGGNAGSTFIRAKGYIITTPYETNTALRWYEMPNGTPTGTAMKHEFFLSDYKADSVNYRAAELIGDNTRGDIIFGANRRGTATALRLRIVRDNVASTYQPSSNQINFNTDNTLDIYGTTLFHRATSRNNFYAGGTGTYQGAITSVGWLITQDSTTTHTYPLELNKSTTGITRMGVTNLTAGTSNGAGIIIRSDIANQFSITALSSGFNSSGTNRQSGVNITAAGSGGLDIGATNAAGALYLSTGGTAATNRRILIDNSGNTIIAVSTKTPLLTLTGLSSGTAGTDSLLTKNPTTNVVGKIAANTYIRTANVLSATATLDFSSTAAQTSSELTITVTGASDGDVVSVGVPSVSGNANSCFTARVSATNTVTVKFNNYSSSAIDPASGTFKVTVFK